MTRRAEHVGRLGFRARRRGKPPVGQRHTVTGVRIRLRSSFRFLWTAQP